MTDSVVVLIFCWSAFLLNMRQKSCSPSRVCAKKQQSMIHYLSSKLSGMNKIRQLNDYTAASTDQVYKQLPSTLRLCRADKLTHSCPWARRGGDSRHFILKSKLHWRHSDPSISSSSLWETRRDEHLNYFLGSTVRFRIYLGHNIR